ncbi:hypothetical protein F2P81_014592 [Scophthalmus maximus]|uniref:Uncharacterized protein n=1 Tax=Scophthalmus maximus TaxID=52904 RepID=A0A6A4SPR4_SCOMX|nr:hypothetical protein F2P81_014592 [Scophthalmus maximus]
MGKDQELLQAVKTEDLLTVQKLLQRPRPGKAIVTCDSDVANCAPSEVVHRFRELLGSAKKVNVNFQDTDGEIGKQKWDESGEKAVMETSDIQKRNKQKERSVLCDLQLIESFKTV